MDHDEIMLKWARWYQKQGFAPFPVGKKKNPLVEWKRLQEEQTTSKEVKEWWSKKWPGANIGLVTGKRYGLVVIDVDSQEGQKIIDENLPDSFLTPIASTPRGDLGRHFYFAYRNGLTNKAEILPGLDVRTDGGFIIAPPSRDHRGSYKWMISLAKTPLNSLPDKLYNVLLSHTNKHPLVNNNTQHRKRFILQKGRRDEDLFHIANSLVKGGCDPSIMAQALRILAKSANPPFPEKEVPIKIKSALQRAQRREGSLTDEVREWVLLQEGYFFITDLIQTLQIYSPKDKKNLTVIINRLKNDGIIEKYGNRRGCYRLVQKDETEMEFIEGEIKEYEIILPLGISDYCVLHPKNIVMIAGTKGSGKTAFLLNTILQNFHRKEIVYFNSEMGSEEWSLRLKNLGFHKKEEITWKNYQRSNNFHDNITGEDKIFIIDFMEIHDNFYEIAKYIRRIHEKLDKGICLIAVQKKAGAMLGRGAEFSLEKARLYLSFDYNNEMRCTTIQIIDAKHPRNPKETVKGMRRDVKIIEGTRFSPLNDWYLPSPFTT